MNIQFSALNKLLCEKYPEIDINTLHNNTNTIQSKLEEFKLNDYKIIEQQIFDNSNYIFYIRNNQLFIYSIKNDGDLSAEEQRQYNIAGTKYTIKQLKQMFNLTDEDCGDKLKKIDKDFEKQCEIDGIPVYKHNDFPLYIFYL